METFDVFRNKSTIFFSNERVQYADSAPIPQQILHVIRGYIELVWNGILKLKG